MSVLDKTRRNALKCLAFGGAGTVFALSGGVLANFDLAEAATRKHATGWSEAAFRADQRQSHWL